VFELEKCGGIVGSSYIFEFSRSINCKWQFLSCTTVAFSELYRPTLYRLPILGLIETVTAMYSHKCVRFLSSMLFLSDCN
jgi:hypothetical protein